MDFLKFWNNNFSIFHGQKSEKFGKKERKRNESFLPYSFTKKVVSFLLRSFPKKVVSFLPRSSSWGTRSERVPKWTRSSHSLTLRLTKSSLILRWKWRLWWVWLWWRLWLWKLWKWKTWNYNKRRGIW